ncbi:MAG: hypothetical protein ACRBM6_09595 [Geminicoccales bacterium]
MSDKPLAGILTALVAVPVMVVCCGGTATFVSAFGGLTSWFSGFSMNTALLIALITAGVFVGIRQIRIRKSEPMAEMKKDNP